MLGISLMNLNDHANAEAALQKAAELDTWATLNVLTHSYSLFHRIDPLIPLNAAILHVNFGANQKASVKYAVVLDVCPS